MHAIRTFLARIAAALMAVALAGASAPLQAAQIINCASSGYRYQYCRANTDNQVRLERQHSSTRCTEGYSWGYDPYGVWVDHGCGAEFRVGREEEQHSNRGRNTALAVGAAVAGLAVLAAISSSNKSSHAAEEVPSWAIGTFSGYDEVEQTDVQVTILPGGQVSGQAARHAFDGQFANPRMRAGRHEFRVERYGNGFTAVDERNAAHRVIFRRTGGGY